MSGAARHGSVWLLASAFLFSSGAFGCTEISAAPAQVSRTFDVAVSDATHKPLAGVRVSIGTLNAYKVMHTLARGTTDANGALRFQNIAVGNLTLQFTDASGDQQYRDVAVVKTGGATSLQYQWPFVNWIPLRSASALLKNNSEPLRHYQVKLLGAPGGEVLGVSDTDQYGRFDLPADQQGRYFIEVLKPDTENGTTTSLGKIPVEVTGDSALPALDTIYLAETSCGLMSDRICRAKPSVAENACFHVVDPQGADVATAYAKLISKAGVVVRDGLRSDSKADFDLSDFAPGEYELEVFANGFAPSQVTVRKSATGADCGSPAVITMNVIGYGCQPSEQRKVN